MSADQSNWEPFQVLEHTLKVSGDALMTGDFASFASIFALPHQIATFEGNRLLKTRDDLRNVFESVHQYIQRNRITALVRECISAEFDRNHQIKSAHTSRYLVGAQQVGQTTMAYGVLTLKDGRWLSTSSQYAVADKTLSKAIIISPDPATNENQEPLTLRKEPAPK